MGDDAIKSSTYAIANYKRMIPNLITWTTKPGDDYAELQELYTEGLGQWSTYVGHVAGLIAGVTVDLKTSDQAGAVFTVVPKARQQAALTFLNDQVFVTPEWLQPAAIAALIGPSGLPARQAAVLNNVLSNARLGRLEAIEKFDATKAWPVAEYMAEVRRMIWQTPQGTAPDANRRALQRAYVDAARRDRESARAGARRRGRRAGGAASAARAVPHAGEPRAERSAGARARATARDSAVGEGRRGRGDDVGAQGALVGHRRSRRRGARTASIVMRGLVRSALEHPLVPGLLASGLFWGLLGYGWWAARLMHRTAGIFVLLWTAGMIGFPYLAIGRGAFTVWIALLDIVLAFLVFKRDSKIPTWPE